MWSHEIPVVWFYKTGNGPSPRYGTEKSACFDLALDLSAVESVQEQQCHGAEKQWSPVLKEDDDEVGRYYVVLYPYYVYLLPTGIRVNLPDGYYMRMYVRSSTPAKYGITLANNVGIIDNDYINDVYMCVKTLTSSPVKLYHGTYLCQAEVVPYVRARLEELSYPPTQKTDRGGGFGSTDKRRFV